MIYCLDFTVLLPYIAPMKRTALLLITILSLLPFTASAQKGWMRMPDGPWNLPVRVHFFDDLNGVVEDEVTSDANDRYGRLLRLTSDGGLTWWTDSSLWRNAKGYCQYPYSNRKSSSTFSIYSSAYGSSIAVFGGEEDVYNCQQREEYISRVWAYNALTKQWSGDSAPTLIGPKSGAAVTTLEIRSGMIHALPYYAGAGGGTMFRSVDFGKSWTSFAVPARDSGIEIIESVFQNADTGFVKSFASDQFGSFDIHMRTVDGCKTWTMILSRRGDPKAISKAFTNYGNNGLWYSRWPDGTLISSSDVGLTWQPADRPPLIDSNEYPDANYDYLSGYNITGVGNSTRIDFTSDRGEFWVEQTVTPEYLKKLSAPSRRVAYAVGNNGLLYKTTDGGGRFAAVAAEEEVTTKMKAWSSGDEIIVENASGDIRVLDLLGRVVCVSEGEKLEGFAPGVYVVMSGDESVKVLIEP